MEKRVIIAFALSVVVFVLYTYLFPPEKPSDKGAVKPDVKTAGPVEKPQTSSPAAAITIPAQSPAVPVTAKVSGRPVRDIAVKTKWFDAVFPNRVVRLKVSS